MNHPLPAAVPTLASPFVFALCQPGAERALKDEVQRRMPALRPAFSRPGFVTFKHMHALAEAPPLDLVFARRWSLSLGRYDTTESLIEAIDSLTLPRPLRLHVSARSLPTDDDAHGLDDAQYAQATRAAIAQRLGEGVAADARAHVGETVLDVIVAHGEPHWLGLHTQRDDQSLWPGGDWPIDLPAHAPSRAYLKLAQALLVSRAPLRAGDTALEIGSAPGGATLALLERGVHVIGVDPGAMDAHVLNMVGPHGARVSHLPVPIGALKREQLPERVDWLLLDVNLAPQVALHSIRRLVPPLRKHLCGMFLTLKLNDWSMAAEIPKFVAQVRELGVIAPRALQLPANRQEIALFGLTGKGARR